MGGLTSNNEYRGLSTAPRSFDRDDVPLGNGKAIFPYRSTAEATFE